MKTMLSSGRNHYTTRVGILLFMIALISGVLGCGEVTPPAQYDLTVSSGTGGSVTTPGEGTFTYGAGAMVDLVAEAEDTYGFAKWTGDVDNIADVSAASTNITMNGD